MVRRTPPTAAKRTKPTICKPCRVTSKPGALKLKRRPPGAWATSVAPRPDSTMSSLGLASPWEGGRVDVMHAGEIHAQGDARRRGEQRRREVSLRVDVAVDGRRRRRRRGGGGGAPGTGGREGARAAGW